MSIIEINNLTKFYGKSRGIEDVSISINKGEIFGFIGKNGAGKSTTIRLILDFLKPNSGTITIDGLDSKNNSKEIKQFTSYLPSEVNYYGKMKVVDLLNYSISFNTQKDYDLIDELCNYFELDKNKKINELSLGNKKKVGIIQALIKKPRIIILDEPTSGLDPLMQYKFFLKLLEEKKKGVTIFLSSHNLQEVEKYCDKVAIIRDGRIQKIDDTIKMSDSFNYYIKYHTEEENKEFVYEGDINELIKELSKLRLKSLEIKTSDIESEFKKYYDIEGNDGSK